jgi:hypothetical protein
MTLDDTLQDCLRRIEGGEPAEQVLNGYADQPELLGLLETALVVRGLPPTAMPATYRELIRRTIDDLEPRATKTFGRRPAAAVLVILAALGVWGLWRQSSNDSEEPRIARPTASLTVQSRADIIASPVFRAPTLAPTETRTSVPTATTVPAVQETTVEMPPQTAAPTAIESPTVTVAAPPSSTAFVALPPATTTETSDEGNSEEPTASPTPEPQGIAGRVTSTDGEPVVGARVRAQAIGGVPAYFVTTDERGDYRVDTDVGDYQVYAEHDLFTGSWFRAAADIDGAEIVPVTAGRTTWGIDIVLSPREARGPSYPSHTLGGAPHQLPTPTSHPFLTLGGAPHQPSTPTSPPSDEREEVLRVPLPDFSAPEPMDVVLATDEILVADARTNTVLRFGRDGAPFSVHAPDATTDVLGCRQLIPIALEFAESDRELSVVWACVTVDVEGVDRSVLDRLYLERTTLGEHLPLQMATLVPMANVSGLVDLAHHPVHGLVVAQASGRLAGPSDRGGPIAQLPSTEAPVLRIAVLADGRIAGVYPERRQVLVFDSAGNQRDRLEFGTSTPVTVASAPTGGIRVLVRPEVPSPSAQLLMEFNAELELVRTWTAADLGTAHPPEGAWPWAMDSSGSETAFSTASNRFAVVTTESSDPWIPIFGAPAKPFFEPVSEPFLVDSNPSIDVDLQRGVVMVDDSSGRLYTVTPDGAVTLRGGLPGAYDVAWGDSGEVYVLTDDAHVARLASPDAIRASWRVECGCSVESRLSYFAGQVRVGRPRAGMIAVFDAQSGKLLDEHGSGDELWPIDVSGPLWAHLSSKTLAGTTQRSTRSGLAMGPWRVDRPTERDVAAALTADGFIEVHDLDTRIVIDRWRVSVDGLPLRAASDIAINDDGLIYVVDGVARRLHVFLPQAPGQPIPEPPEPSASTCEVTARRRLDPPAASPDEWVEVTIWLAANCEGTEPLLSTALLLLVDRSASMGGPRAQEARSAARRLVELTSGPGTRIGLATFAADVDMPVAIGGGAAAVLNALDNLRAAGTTNLGAAVATVRGGVRELAGDDALPVIVLISDGDDGQPAAAASAIAAARDLGVRVYAVPIGGAASESRVAELLRDDGRVGRGVVSEAAQAVFEQIVDDRLTGWASRAIVVEPAEDPSDLQVDQTEPPLIREHALIWHHDVLPSAGVSTTYAMRVHPGTSVVGEGAYVTFVDPNGEPATVLLPTAMLEINPATPSPTPSLTPTATPTSTLTPVVGPRSRTVFLPLVEVDRCRNALHLVLLVPRDSGPLGEDLAGRVAVAEALLAAVNWDRDSVGLIGFDSQAELAATGRNRSAVLTALRGFTPRAGDRWDLALGAARADIAAAGAGGSVRGVVIALGGPVPMDPLVRLSAKREAAKLAADGDALHVLVGRENPFYADLHSVVNVVPGGPSAMAEAAVKLVSALPPCP